MNLIQLTSVLTITALSPVFYTLFTLRGKFMSPVVVWNALGNISVYQNSLQSRLFTFVLSFVNPYSRSIPLRFTDISLGYCEAILFDSHWIRNPFKSIHACALTLLAETVGGMAVFTTLKGDRAIVSRIDTTYYRKSRGTLKATCKFERPQKTGKLSNVPCEVEIKSAGEVTCKATIYWEMELK